MWLAIHLPRLPLEALARGAEPGQAPAVAVLEGGRLVVCHPGIEARGLREGMVIAAAYALVPELRAVARDARAEAAALEGLALWSGQFTSFVSVAPPADLLLEVGASERLFGGLESLRARVRAGLEALGYEARLALAPTPEGASILARAGPDPAGQPLVRGLLALERALARVPLECMALEPECLEALRGMGLGTLGDCLRLPRAGFARRAGRALVARLDRALGRAPDARRRHAPPRSFRRRLALPAEIESVESLLFAVRRLLLELAGYLRSVGCGVEGLDLDCLHRGGRRTRLALVLVAPSDDPTHLEGLLRERLERTPLPAPIESIELATRALGPLASRTASFFPGLFPGGQDRAGEEEAVRLVERLEARFGESSVRGLRVVAEHRPERAWAFGRPGEAGPTAPLASGRRPLWLVEPPEALGLGTPVLDGHALSIEDGPERIESGWWDGGDVARDYFVARTPAGERLWIFRERRPPRAWFLHGMFG